MQEEYVPVPGGSLWTLRRGRGRPVVLCPGGPGCCDYLAPLAELIEDRAEVIRFEPRGCGRSSPAGSADLESCIDDLERLRAHFGHVRWLVIGHSFGADLGLVYAIARPAAVEALVALAGRGVQNDRGWYAHYRRERRRRGEWEPGWLFPPNHVLNAQLNAAWFAWLRRAETLREVASLSLPALFLHGDRDIRPAWPAMQLAALLPAARFEWIAGAEHFPWAQQPAALRDHLHAFLDALEGGRW